MYSGIAPLSSPFPTCLIDVLHGIHLTYVCSLIIYFMLELFLLYCNVLQKVELRKADVAWKRTSEVSTEQTEEEKEAQVTRYHSAWLSSCTVKPLPCNPLCH